ncbi:hypothetical protein ACGFYO_21165 [Streptomyces sp. NPDC048201]|uniref:hypothetical protein n=1 Tax=Streptomyces sp. NPDC048201 TaxID=3365513 RepID=UPI003720BBE5
MSDQQSYEGGPYSGYDPYGQQQAPGNWAPAQGQPQYPNPYADPYGTPQAAAGYDAQPAQQWQGQTWDTQNHARVPVAEQPYPAPQATPAPQPVRAPEDPAQAPALTAADRARLEGRPQIVEPGVQPAALTALLGALLAVAAPFGSYALVVPLVLLQAVTAAGWFRLNGMWPARQGIALAFLGGLVADAAVLAAGREHAPAAILGPLGIWVLLSLVFQLRSHASPDERMYGLMVMVVSSALAILATGYLGASAHAVSVGAAAVAVAVLARALPLPTPVSVVVSLLAAAGTGIAVGDLTGLGTGGAALGAGAAVCALIGHRVASYDYPSRFVHFTAGVALPLAAAAPAVWLLGRVFA